MVKRVDWKNIEWGSLTRWLLKHRQAIKHRYGDPFRRDGKISKSVLKRLVKDEKFLRKLSKTRYKKIKKKIHFYLNVIR